MKSSAHLKIENHYVYPIISNHKLSISVADFGAYELKAILTSQSQWYG
jgi:hypothetical protein